jgi:lipoprotein signal peptidase
MRRQPALVLTVLLAIVYLDQVTKAWAWRHLVEVHVNSGGDLLLGSSGLGSWFRDPIAGAAFDVVDAMLLGTAGGLLVRRRRPLAVVMSGTILLAGWSSNLLDRLGLHYLTAPGSVRGVVDFMPWRDRYWNVADVAIVIGGVGLALALVVAGLRARVKPRRPSQPYRPLARARLRVAAAGGALTASALAVVGAIGYAGVSGPVTALAARR